MKITNVVINVGLKEILKDKGLMEKISEGLALITGQRPKVCLAKKDIAGFNLRAGSAIGLMVTLRKKRMDVFLQKLFHAVLPRIKDFQGLSLDSFDGQGNYTIGLTEHIVFPEIDPAKVEKIHGLEITIVTDGNNDQSAKKLLKSLGAPFKKNGKDK